MLNIHVTFSNELKLDIPQLAFAESFICIYITAFYLTGDSVGRLQPRNTGRIR